MKNKFIIYLIYSILISGNTYAQAGAYYTNVDTVTHLCRSWIYCYNDSLAFWDDGCENHVHTVSILHYEKNGDTISFKTLEDGFDLLIKKIEKKRGPKNKATMRIIGLNGYNEVADLRCLKWVRDTLTQSFHYVMEDKTAKYSRENRNAKCALLAPDNLFPLLFDDLKVYRGKLYNNITAYINLPPICLFSVEGRFWTNISLQ